MFARLLLIFLFTAAPQTAEAQVAAADSGDTAWMTICAVLVLLGALPGMMLRHAGHSNVRNTLSVAAQGLAVVAGVSLAWGVAGYSLSFAPGSAWLGGGTNLFLAQLGTLREGLTVPESAFVLFQMVLALFAACLLTGTLAGRVRIGWIASFAPLWLLIVYAPIAHAIWGGGWLANMGVIDEAGGLVMQATAGFSVLALLLISGRRRLPATPGHAPLLNMAGGALLWTGWAGIVGGWALGATDNAASAILNMHFAACAGVLGWMASDRLISGRVSATGLLSGAVAGLAAISASAGLVGVGGAMAIGLVAAVLGRLIKMLSSRWIDDPTDIFVVHGLSGTFGALVLPLFVLPELGGVGFDAGISARSTMLAQLTGAGFVAVWAMVGSTIIALLVSMPLPMRGTAQEEAEGLDATQHGQQGWDFR